MIDRGNRKISQLAGLHTGGDFFREVENWLTEAQNDGVCCIIAIDIDHFKLYNEWYGHEEGDRLLAEIGSAIQKTGYPAAYMGGDDFAVLVPDRQEVIRSFMDQLSSVVRTINPDVGFLPCFGICPVHRGTSLPVLYDRAVLAMSEIKGNYTVRWKRYDEAMIQEAAMTHRLLTDLQGAVKRGEISFYLQPQCRIDDGRIVGFEALVRWNHPEYGLLTPGRFVPMLEKNGLITSMDLGIWEQVAEGLGKLRAMNKSCIPVSVNVSRLDLLNIDVPEVFCRLAKKHGVERKYLQIEITESVYAEDSQRVGEVIDRLRELGFTVLMDDFGSGYSSLNMLSEVNVDILKIDMRFVQNIRQSDRKSLGILETIIRMARLLGMRVLAEGIENEQQKQYLQGIGCHYGQGYYFYRPMAGKDMDRAIAEGAELDYGGICLEESEELQADELLTSGFVGQTMINKVVGGLAIYSAAGDKIELLRANDHYYKIVRTNLHGGKKANRNIISRIYEEDRSVFQRIFRDAREKPEEGGEGDLRYVREDGLIIWLHVKMFLLADKKDHELYCGAISDLLDVKAKIGL